MAAYYTIRKNFNWRIKFYGRPRKNLSNRLIYFISFNLLPVIKISLWRLPWVPNLNIDNYIIKQSNQKAVEKIFQSKTVIAIAHRLSTIENSDKILVMQQGQIVEEGKHQILLNKNGVYQKLYEIETLKSNEKNWTYRNCCFKFRKSK